ncbi:hypothetical protein [Dyadobacter sp. NIV53]|uniref:hypothetical protein n=1 Tax=Dyadobacter sp. NIV53 TaxID=2861765 RepID=UPI001C8859D9|nr:hypothetical protein [Dyadobacter sp. NIV53]
MNPKLLKTILLALSVGFFVMWILEFRRAGMFESYWLLLLSILCLLYFQFKRVKAALELRKKEEITMTAQKPKSSKTVKK